LKFSRAVVAVLLVVGCATPTGAQTPYSLDPTREAVLLGAGVGVSLAGLAVQDAIVPLTPEEVGALSRADVNPFDRGATNRYSTSADELSDWLVYGLMASPLLLLASQPVRDDIWTYGTMYGETLLLTLAAASLTKGVVPRTRPFAYNPEVPMGEKTDVDARTSFYSTHTAFAFAAAVFMSVTFQAYEPESPLRPWIWVSSLTAAMVVSALRYTSGSHFPTDILVGAGVGTLAGIAVPALHRVGGSNLGVSPAFGSRGVQISLKVSM